MSSYMKRKFIKDFHNGCEFWTGEDGMLVSIVFLRQPDWKEVLARDYSHRLIDPVDPRHGKERFVERGRYYASDGDDFPPGPIWRLTDGPTEFPVIEYQLPTPV